jgi:hypothetical protein
MKREKYRNGDSVGLAANGCDGCQLASINGQLCHETGCPEAWRDNSIECADCGCDFIRSERDETICPDCSAAADPDFIPSGIEVFYRSRGENRRDGWTDSDGQPLGAGWFWWSCFPSCIPDSDPIGPFGSEREAIDDCKGF